ncbi:serine hydrolase domain-containing protein [Agromyces humatus]|uniref:Serine hydrolase domain-containing protein n=2 Tax=Agromyces humatus TaxID=279573 RepID=A0ABN2KMD4_9MICO
MAVALAVSACTGDPAPAAAPRTPSSAAAVDPVAGSAGACVPDAQRVATAKDTQSTEPMPAELSADYDAAASAVFERVKDFAPAVIVGVRSPEGTWTEAYGVADLSTGTAATTDMHQRIASITKTFVGTVVLQLADEGTLSLDHPIDDYVPSVPNGSRITLRELITMTSGLPNYSNSAEWGAEFLSDTAAQWTPEQLLADAWAMPTSFAPGSNMEYSNTNFVLLGMVIEHVTGQSVGDAVQSRILEPLQLEATDYPSDAAFPSPHLNGYTLPLTVYSGADPTDVWVNAADWNPSSTGAAGIMTSRVDDLLVWGRALATGQGVLSESAQVLRLGAFATANLGAGEFYGEALMCKDGWIGHNGNMPGYNSMVRYNPQTDTTIVVAATGLDATGTPPRVFVIEEYAAALADTAGHSFSADLVPPAAQVQGLVPHL